MTYTVTGPLASLMPERVMMRYEQISTFLLKLKTMEFQLQQAWQVLPAPNCAHRAAATMPCCRTPLPSTVSTMECCRPGCVVNVNVHNLHCCAVGNIPCGGTQARPPLPLSR